MALFLGGGGIGVVPLDVYRFFIKTYRPRNSLRARERQEQHRVKQQQIELEDRQCLQVIQASEEETLVY